jgi:PAS domain S-box-containing protein
MTTESQELWSNSNDSSTRCWYALITQLHEAVAIHELVYSDQGTPVDCRIIDVNAPYETYLGIERNTAIGKLATELKAFYSPQNFEDFCDISRSGVPRTLEVHDRQRNRSLSVSIAPLGRNVFATIFSDGTDVGPTRDATRLHEAELATQHAAETLLSYFTLSLDVVCVVDQNGKFVGVNPAWQHTLGHLSAEVVGERYIDFVHPDDIESTLKATRSLIEGRPFRSFENRCRHRNGSYRWLEWRPLGPPLGDPQLTCALATDVTERHVTEAALRESEERFRTLFQLSPNPIAIVSLDGLKLVELNHAYGAAVGSNRETLIKEAAYCVFLNDPSVLGDAEPHSGTGAHFDDVEVEYQRPGYARRIYRVSGRVIKYAGQPHVIVSAYDVTKLREAEQAESRNREQLIRVSEIAHIGHFSANVRTGVTEWTAELFRIYGRKQDSFIPTISTMRAQVILEDRLRTDKAMVFAAKRCTSQRVEFRVRRPDGEVRHCLAIVEGHVPNESSPFDIYGLIQDLTELKHTEEERRKLEQRVLHAQKLESLGVLAGGIAHDFNNLLTSILGNTDLALADLPPNNPIGVYLADIEVVSRRAADLCRQMLAYSGRGRFVVQPVALNQLVEEVTHHLSASADKSVVIRCNLHDNLPAVMADASQLRQVIVNLVTNSSEAIGDGAGVVTLTTGTLVCDEAYFRTVVRDSAEHAPGHYVFLEVADTGCGMTQANLDRIFDPFFTTKFTGRGLGLAAVMGIVRGHQGALKIQSETGKGTVLRVLFPAYHQAVQAPNVAPPTLSRWMGHGFVLLVEDEQTILNLGRQLLTRVGFEVITATNGRDAIEQFVHRKDDIRLVVLDLTMPQLDGEACFRQLRSIDPHVKVILTSGYDEQDVVGRFEGMGLAGFVQKPYQAVDLLPVIRSTLGE